MEEYNPLNFMGIKKKDLKEVTSWGTANRITDLNEWG